MNSDQAKKMFEGYIAQGEASTLSKMSYHELRDLADLANSASQHLNAAACDRASEDAISGS